MNDFFSGFLDKLKTILSLLATGVLAFIGYKLISQDKQIESLELEKDKAEADNLVKEKQGELNEIKHETEAAEHKFEKSNDDLKSNLIILEELRRNRPK